MIPLMCSEGGGDHVIAIRVECRAYPEGISGAAVGTVEQSCDHSCFLLVRFLPSSTVFTVIDKDSGPGPTVTARILIVYK